VPATETIGNRAVAASAMPQPAGTAGSGAVPASGSGAAAAPDAADSATRNGACALTVTAVFGAPPGQVRHARRFAEAVLAGWPATDDAVLVVSELATNAVLHSASGRGGQFWVHLTACPGEYVWIEVSDEGGPWTRPGGSDGRPHGLDIVARLAAECGVDGDPHTGWTVWARLELARPGIAAVMMPAVGAAAVANGYRRDPDVAGGHGTPLQRELP